MGIGEKLISASGATEDPTDSDFDTVLFLTHFDGANGGWNELATNDATGGDTLEPTTSNSYRAFAQGTWTPFREAGTYSVAFDQANTQYAYTNFSSYQTYGTYAFSVSFWVWVNKYDSSGVTFFDNRPASTNGNYNTIYSDTSGNLYYYANSAARITGSSAISLNTWHHIVLSRGGDTSGVTKMYVDGSQVGSDYTDGLNYGNNAGVRAYFGVSSYNTALSFKLNGFMTDFAQGNALSTSEVAAKYSGRRPTAIAYPYHSLVWPKVSFSHNRADRSIRNQVINISGSPKISGFSPFKRLETAYENTDGGSAHFDGGSGYNVNYLNPAIALNQNTFTCEAWIYMTATPNDGTYDIPAAFDLNGTGGAYSRMQWGVQQDMRLTLRWYDGTVKNCQGSTTYMSLYQWYHIAVSVSSGTIYLFVNGLSQSKSGTGTLTTRQGSTNTLTSWGAGIHTYCDYYGYIAGVRIQDGTAQYTSTFNPSTSPPTENTNCNVLVNYTGSDSKDMSQHNNVMFAGNVVLNTSQSKFGGSSIYLDGGAANRVVFPAYPAAVDFNFATSDWTIECFIRMDSVSGGYQCIFHASNVVQFMVYQDQLFLNVNDTDDSSGYMIQAWGTDGHVAAANTWYHVAAYRVGSAFYTSVDGAVSSMGTSSGVIAQPLATACEINWSYYPFAGYIDEFRISRKARYGSSNFTPPSAAFPDIGE